MEPNNPPQQPPVRDDLDARVLAWIELKEQMQHVHAQLEYVRLMLKLGIRS